MEMLVALMLFSVVVTVSTDVFFTFQRASRKTENLETVVASARLIMERIAREAREGAIDYAWYSTQTGIDLSDPQDSLVIRNRQQEQIQFNFDGQRNALMLDVGGDIENLASSGVNMRNARFSISPHNDPFRFDINTGRYAEDAQPRVTVFLSLDNAYPPDHRDYVRYDVQTTISSRVYQR